MVWSRVGLVACGLLLAMVACGGDAAQTTKASCVPGAQVGCVCTDGVNGSQVCREDGTGYGVCTCERPPSGVEGGAADDALAGRSNAGSSGGGSDGTDQAEGGTGPDAGGAGQAVQAGQAGQAGDAGNGPTGPALDFPEEPIFETGAPANAPELFGDPQDFSAGELCVLEPQLSAGAAPGAMFPSNWLRPRFRLAASSFDLFEIRLRAAAEKHELVVYTTKPTWYLPRPIWRGHASSAGLAVAAAGDSVTVTVRALNIDSPGTPVGVRGSFSIAPVQAAGSVVFATDDGKGLSLASSQHWGFSLEDEGVGKVLGLPQLAWSAQLGEDGAELRGYYDDPPPPGFALGQPRLIARHAIAPDGKSVIFTDDWPWAKVAAQLTNSVGAVPTYLGKGGIALLKMPWWGDQSMSAAHFKSGDRVLLTSYGATFRSGIARTKAWQALPFYDLDPNDSDLIGSHRLAWVDLESSANIDVAVGPTPDYGASLTARNAAVAAAKGTAWGLIATGETGVSNVSPRFNPAGDRIVYVTTDDSPEGHPSSTATTADLRIVPYNDREGEASSPLDGASDPEDFEYDPAFSSDGNLIAFTRAPADGVDGPYRNRFGEVTIVPSTGGEPLTGC